jgi:hypothetical protein
MSPDRDSWQGTIAGRLAAWIEFVVQHDYRRHLETSFGPACILQRIAGLCFSLAYFTASASV